MFNFMRLQTFLSLIVMAVLISGCTEKPINSKDESNKIQLPPRLDELVGNNESFNLNSAFISIDDELAMLYSDGSGIIFQKGQNKTKIKSDDGATQRFWLHYNGKNLYAVWWRKFTKRQEGNAGSVGKELSVSVSEDKGKTFSESVVISTDYGVLPTVSIASDPNGQVAIAYHDERNSDFQVYMNVSKDGGKTWQEKDIRVDLDSPKSILSNDKTPYRSSAIQPTVYMLDKDRAIVLWQQADNANGLNALRFNSRIYNFGNNTFSDVNTLYEPDNSFSLVHKTVQYKNNILVLLDIKEQGVVGILSTDDGVSWTDIGSNYADKEFSKGASTDGFISAVGSGENIFVLNTFKPNQDAKSKIDFSVVSFNEKKWLKKATTFDTGKDHKITRSTFPLIDTVGKNNIIAAWTDYRHLLPTVHINKSHDQGNIWLDQPNPLTTPGYKDFAMKKLITGNEKVWILSTSLETGKNNKASDVWYYQVASITDNKIADFSPAPVLPVTLSVEDKKKRLETRVKEFWKLRKEAKWEATFAYFDPLYRVGFGKSNFLKTQGKITFGDYKLEEIIVGEGNLSSANGRIELATSQQNYEEGLVEASPFKEQEARTEWGWFYDDWYLMPKSFFLKVHDF